MLVLTRKLGEVIVIGDDIEISVVEIRGDSVRLGIAAPSVVRILRKEICMRIREENESAVRAKNQGKYSFLKNYQQKGGEG